MRTGTGSTQDPASVNPTRPSNPGAPSQPVPEAAGPPTVPWTTPLPAEEPSDRAIEEAALEGAAAIRRILAERNELRRERERLLALNDELLRQSEKMSRLRDRYRQLATELLVQLRQISLTIQDVSRKAAHDLSPDTEQEKDSGAEELARRFAPTDKAG